MLLPIDEIILSLPSYAPEEIEKLRQALPGPQQAGESLDLQAELVAQFKAAKALFEKAQTNTDIPLNQLAQVINSAAALLKQLSSTQSELFTAERFRCAEAALIDSLKAFPELQEKFLADYTARLESIK